MLIGSMLDHFFNSAPSVCRHLRSPFPFLHDFLLGNIWPKKIFRIQEAHKVFSFWFVSKQNIQLQKVGLLVFTSVDLSWGDSAEHGCTAGSSCTVSFSCELPLSVRDYFGLLVSFSFVLWLITWVGRIPALIRGGWAERYCACNTTKLSIVCPYKISRSFSSSSPFTLQRGLICGTQKQTCRSTWARCYIASNSSQTGALWSSAVTTGLK